jgi:hypothetical protein
MNDCVARVKRASEVEEFQAGGICMRHRPVLTLLRISECNSTRLLRMQSHVTAARRSGKGSAGASISAEDPAANQNDRCRPESNLGLELGSTPRRVVSRLLLVWRFTLHVAVKPTSSIPLFTVSQKLLLLRAAVMAHLDLFLQRGPQNGDVEASLEELRRIVLTDGIPANPDGTVSCSTILVYLCLHH